MESNHHEQAPLRLFERWLAEARAAGVHDPGFVAFVTVGEGGHPSARTVLLKRVEEDALVFTSALWTRKAREIADNPRVALLFYWPPAERQVHVTGRAAVAERELAVELFASRDLSHQVQTLVSRQGEPIMSITGLAARPGTAVDPKWCNCTSAGSSGAALDGITRAVVDLPNATIRRHLRDGERLPSWLEHDVAAATRKLLEL